MASARDGSHERKQTDESLRSERKNTDRALAERQAEVENEADTVVQRARDDADAIVEVARDRADHDHAGGLSPPSVIERRAVADETLRTERAVADDALHHEREENDLTLARLLPLEREKTDRHLLTERSRSDSAVTNRDDFLGIVSHDLRNLLGGIVLGAQMLEQRAIADDDEAASYGRVVAQRIQRYSARMNRLIGDLLDVASIDAGKLAMHPTYCESTALLAEVVETFEPAAAAKSIKLEIAPSLDPCSGRFDHERLLQVLANLLTNAIKFTAEGGSIRLAVERGEGDLHFRVVDSGAGIDPSMLEAVFERFWQAGKSDRRGVGLGLYISRCIVEAHGGRIKAESVLGSGSSFTFTIPQPTGAPSA